MLGWGQTTETEMGIIERIAVDDATYAKLSQKADEHGRTVAEEAAEALRRSFMEKAEFRRMADKIAALTPSHVVQTDSTRLIREDRDR